MSEQLEQIVQRAKDMEDSVIPNRVETRQVKLSNGMTLWQFIHDHFAEVQRLYKRIAEQAKREWGDEGWRMVSFEGLALCLAADDYHVEAAKAIETAEGAQ